MKNKGMRGSPSVYLGQILIKFPIQKKRLILLQIFY